MNLQKQDPAAVKEGVTATILVIIAAVVGVMMPFAGILIYFAAIPFFTITRKYGFMFILPFAFMAYIFVGFYLGFINAIFDVLAVVIPAVVMGELSRLNRGQPEVLVKGIVASILFNFAALASQFFSSGEHMIETLRALIQEPMDQALAAGEMTIHTAQVVRDTYEMMLKTVPSIIFLWAVVVVLLIYYIGCSSLIKRGMVIEKYAPFREFSFSRSLIFGVAIIYLLALLAITIGLVDGQALYLNLFIIIWFLFVLQGTAVMTFFCGRVRMPRGLFALMLGILFISVFGTFALLILGLVDILVNFRARSAGDKG